MSRGALDRGGHQGSDAAQDPDPAADRHKQTQYRFERECQDHVGDEVESRGHRPREAMLPREQDASRDAAPNGDQK